VVKSTSKATSNATSKATLTTLWEKYLGGMSNPQDKIKAIYQYVVNADARPLDLLELFLREINKFKDEALEIATRENKKSVTIEKLNYEIVKKWIKSSKEEIPATPQFLSEFIVDEEMRQKIEGYFVVQRGKNLCLKKEEEIIGKGDEEIKKFASEDVEKNDEEQDGGEVSKSGDEENRNTKIARNIERARQYEDDKEEKEKAEKEISEQKPKESKTPSAHVAIDTSAKNTNARVRKIAGWQIPKGFSK
jgi:hypothetical protein